MDCAPSNDLSGVEASDVRPLDFPLGVGETISSPGSPFLRRVPAMGYSPAAWVVRARACRSQHHEWRKHRVLDVLARVVNNEWP
jgi:hypothetical protein